MNGAGVNVVALATTIGHAPMTSLSASPSTSQSATPGVRTFYTPRETPSARRPFMTDASAG
jgi:hypothetical protein